MKKLINFDFEQQDRICYLKIIKEVYVVKIGFWIGFSSALRQLADRTFI